MRIVYVSHFLRSLRNLASDIRDEFNRRLMIFRENPFDSRLRTHKLSGNLSGCWSFSITHKHRVVFKFDNGVVKLVDIGDHDVYR